MDKNPDKPNNGKKEGTATSVSLSPSTPLLSFSPGSTHRVPEERIQMDAHADSANYTRAQERPYNSTLNRREMNHSISDLWTAIIMICVLILFVTLTVAFLALTSKCRILKTMETKPGKDAKVQMEGTRHSVSSNPRTRRGTFSPSATRGVSREQSREAPDDGLGNYSSAVEDQNLNVVKLIEDQQFWCLAIVMGCLACFVFLISMKLVVSIILGILVS